MQFNIFPEVWQVLGLLVMTLLVLVALMFDLTQRRIPNRLVVLMVGIGLLINLIGPQAAHRMAGLFSDTPGALGIKGAGLGALTGLVVFLPFYLLHAMGAGDVKFMAGIGSFVGSAAVVNISLFILITGGVLAMVRMVWAGKSRLVMFNVVTALGQLLHGSSGTFDPAIQSADRMPYAVAMAGGLLAYGVWIFSGHFPLISF